MYKCFLFFNTVISFVKISGFVAFIVTLYTITISAECINNILGVKKSAKICVILRRIFN